MVKFILSDTAKGKELVLPVTPKGYEIEHGRKVSSLDMQAVGAVNLPGAMVLLDTELECLLPSRVYPFAQPGSGTNPWVYLEQLQKWSDAGTVLRFVISGTPVNGAVLLDPIRYREQDGTGDLYCVIPMRGYRKLAADTVQSNATGNAARGVEGQPQKQQSYTVKAGDTLSALARKFYGNAALYGKLAAANGIANPNLIRVGQVLKLPDLSALPPPKTPSKTQQVAAATQVVTSPTTGKPIIQTEPRIKNLLEEAFPWLEKN